MRSMLFHGYSLAAVPLIAGVFVAIAFILQIVTLSYPNWGEFYASTENGFIYENGQFGFWKLCFARAPRFTLSCDPTATFFKTRTFALVAGILASAHAVILFALLVILVFRVWQVLSDDEDSYLFYVSPQTLGWIRTILAFLAVALCLAAMIFSLYMDDGPDYYTVQPDWAFWLEVVVFILDLFIFFFCVCDNVQLARYSKIAQDSHMDLRQSQDSSGTHGSDFSTAYSNPNFSDFHARASTVPIGRLDPMPSFSVAPPGPGVTAARFSPVPNNYANADIRSSSIGSIPGPSQQVVASVQIKNPDLPPDNEPPQVATNIPPPPPMPTTATTAAPTAAAATTAAIPPPPPPPPPPPGGATAATPAAAPATTANAVAPAGNIPPPPPPPPMPGGDMQPPAGMAPGQPHTIPQAVVNYGGRTIISIGTEGTYQNPIYET